MKVWVSVHKDSGGVCLLGVQDNELSLGRLLVWADMYGNSRPGSPAPCSAGMNTVWCLKELQDPKLEPARLLVQPAVATSHRMIELED